MSNEYEIGCGLTLKQEVEIDTWSEDGKLDIRALAELRDGRYVCVDLRATSRGTEGVTSEKLRELTVGFYVEWAAETENPGIENELSARAREAMESSKRVTDELLEVVSATYRWGYATSGSPTAKVMETFGIERPRAARWVAQARERGFLGSTDMRRPGGVIP